MYTCILCNSDYQVLTRIHWKRAVALIVTGRADSIRDGRAVVSSAYTRLPVPEIAALREHVAYTPWGLLDEPVTRATAPRRAVIERDGGVCQYCGREGTTVDHVVPRARGGLTVWDNLVCSCEDCNFWKGDRLLSEIGWELPAVSPPRRRDVRARALRSLAADQELVFSACAELVSG